MDTRERNSIYVVLRAILVAVAYFASARLGYAFGIPDGIVSLWPPAGVMLALLIVSPKGDWPSILAGGFVGSVASDSLSAYPIGRALAAAGANVAESFVAARFVTMRLGPARWIWTLRGVVALTIGAAVVCNALTSVLGAAMMHYGNGTPWQRGWLSWWVGDGLGMLVVAPVVLALWTSAGTARTAKPSRFVELIVMFVGIAVAAQIALGPSRGWNWQPAAYTVFPLLFWAALRFGPAGAALASLVIATIATWNAALGVGPFVEPGFTGVSTALHLYAYLAVASLSSLIAAAVLEERKMVGRHLQESEGRYRAVVDAATDVIVTIDAHSRIELANPAVERVFGYRPEELIGRELTVLMPERLRSTHTHAIGRYLQTGERHIEWRGVSLPGLHKDGHEIPLELSFGELIHEGRHVFTGVLRDVSEKHAAAQALRAAEDRLRFTLEAARVGVWEMDIATGVTEWSETMETLHGLPPGGFAGQATNFFDRIHPEDVPAVRDGIDGAARQLTDASIRYRTIWPDGSLHWISWIGRTTYDATGKPVRAAGIALDVTEHRALEEQYRQSQKMEAVGQLAGGVAHDFNNLLTAITGYGTLLAEALSPANPLQSDVGEILRAAERAASLTRQLLAFSRHQMLAPRVLDLAESLREMTPMLSRLIGEDIDLVVDTSRPVGPVKADPVQIEQVILNLAINARDAMPEGGRLMITVENVAIEEADHPPAGVTPGMYVMLEVADTGMGMDPATLARVFEPFFTTKAPGKGTGLGLSTVHGIIVQSGGSVTVKSEPGEGSVFRVYLPRIAGPVLVADRGALENPLPRSSFGA